METFSFKIPEHVNEALDSLANRWKCNRAESARRAIQIAANYDESVGNTTIDSSHLQEIIEAQKRTIELLIDLAKFGPLAAKINRLEGYVVQACLTAGMLAKQAGLYESAKKEYNVWKQNREGGI